MNIFLKKDEFIECFGSNKTGKTSWSGKVAPSKYNITSQGGQTLLIDFQNEKVIIEYDYNYDARLDKNERVHEKYKNKKIIIAFWTFDRLRDLVENKFNKGGFCYMWSY